MKSLVSLRCIFMTMSIHLSSSFVTPRLPTGRLLAITGKASRHNLIRIMSNMRMASQGHGIRREENVPGNFFVDESCIDCDTCRWMSSCFTRQNGMSAVTSQPENEKELFRALQAMSACPTRSIRTQKPEKETKNAMRSFPIPIQGVSEGKNSLAMQYNHRTLQIYHCGFHSVKTYGATSYFIQRSSASNILIDSPRFNKLLADKLADMGGVEYMFLTHADDVGDHAEWAQRFGSKRIIHEKEVSRSASLSEVEIILHGEGPWSIVGNNHVTEDDEVKIVFQPGHTRGHCVLIYRHKEAFTGDHLAVTPDSGGRLAAFRRQCWYSWDQQIASMEQLQGERFRSVLPGHGRSLITTSYAEAKAQLEACIRWMKESA